MTETVLCSLISAIAAIVVCVINSNVQQQKMLSEMEKRDALQTQRIEQLEKKMDKHNHIIERMYHAEERLSVQENDIKSIGHRVTDLEKKG